MWIFNTRPAERAAQLSCDLTALGYLVQELPLLELKPLPLDEYLRQQFAQFCSAHTVVVVSSIAAQLGMQHYQALGYSWADLQQKTWIAVGKSTQKTLAGFSISSLCPSIETSEGMLQLPELQAVEQQTVAFWRGQGGRLLMMQHLQQQGCQILNMLLYKRQLPVYDAVQLTQQFTHFPAIVLLSSEESWNNWRKLVKQFGVLTAQLADYVYIVLGDRVSQRLKQHFAQQALSATVLTIDRLDAQMIHQQLQQYYRHE